MKTEKEAPGVLYQSIITAKRFGMYVQPSLRTFYFLFCPNENIFVITKITSLI